jgi:hypothetical protein
MKIFAHFAQYDAAQAGSVRLTKRYLLQNIWSFACSETVIVVPKKLS